MHERKQIKIPILAGEKLFIDQCLKTQEEVEYISRVPYASAIGNLIYVMVYIRLNIGHVVVIPQVIIILTYLVEKLVG